MAKRENGAGVCRVGFKRLRKKHRHSLGGGKGDYRIDAGCQPINRSVEICGPADGIRWLRGGSHDFSSFAELAKTVAFPGMTDVEKAMAVYRFSSRHATHGGMGWGNTEMTRFLNAFGYSFCWGQADFQHLLYEAVGLRARAPGLKGHSSVEVLIDGRWCMLDAYMQLVLPSPELDGLATGQELMENPWLFDAARSVPGRVRVLRDYWSKFVAGNTYEPWQDSRAMVLSLRRGEKLRFDYGRRDVYCVAPGEPPDFVNGEWTWRPKLDEEHLADEVEAAVNVVAADGGLRADGCEGGASIDYRVHSPYPLCKGRLRLRCTGNGSLRVAVSVDNRKTWTALRDGPAGRVDVELDGALSPATLDNIGEVQAEVLTRATVCDAIVRLEFSGPVTLRGLSFSLLVQANAPSLPQVEQGVNQWKLVSCSPTNAITHCWDEFPEFSVSDPSPYEGDVVALSLRVHNRADRARRRVPVRFVLAGTGVEIGEVVIPGIRAGGAVDVSMPWTAKIVPDRAKRGRAAEPSLYVHSVIEARVGEETPHGEYSGIARAHVTVRPRPLPRVDDRLVWSSDARFAHERKVVLRAALVNELGRDVDPRLTYVPDASLTATLTPYLGHPDRGGVQLADGVCCEAVQPTEFSVAEWTLNTESLPKTFDVFVEVCSDAPVASEKQRLLVRRRVRTARQDLDNKRGRS